MKTIGRTTEHNAIVEMTPEEYRLISRLAQVMNGKDYDDWPEMMRDYDILEMDLSPAFEAIVTFARGKMLVNSLEHYVQQLNETIMHRADESAPE